MSVCLSVCLVTRCSFHYIISYPFHPLHNQSPCLLTTQHNTTKHNTAYPSASGLYLPTYLPPLPPCPSIPSSFFSSIPYPLLLPVSPDCYLKHHTHPHLLQKSFKDRRFSGRDGDIQRKRTEREGQGERNRERIPLLPLYWCLIILSRPLHLSWPISTDLFPPSVISGSIFCHFSPVLVLRF